MVVGQEVIVLTERESINMSGLQKPTVLLESFLWQLICEIRVDHADVSLATHLRDEGRLNFLPLEGLPVYVSEEGMSLNFLTI